MRIDQSEINSTASRYYDKQYGQTGKGSNMGFVGLVDKTTEKEMTTYEAKNRQRNNNNTNAQRRAQRVARQKKQLKEYNKRKDYQKQLTEDAIERREMLEEKNKLAGSRQMPL